MTKITQEHLDALDLAIASGEMTVSAHGRTVTYQSTDAMLKARAHIANLLAAQKKPQEPKFGGRGYGLACFDRD